MPQELSKKPEVRPPGPEFEPTPEEPEAIPEIDIEMPGEKEKEEPAEVSPPPAPVGSAPAEKPKKDPTTTAVEKILEEDLGDLYVKLDPQTRKKFQDEGDKLVVRIKDMVDHFKVKARKVVTLIRDWLKIIPGINKYFLEQEAKIKTDKILELAEEQKNKQQGEI
jgi:hypothetical protein